MNVMHIRVDVEEQLVDFVMAGASYLMAGFHILVPH
jgi:hypothetical protein